MLPLNLFLQERRPFVCTLSSLFVQTVSTVGMVIKMSYRCCSLIDRFALNINGRIDTGKPVLSLCCEELPDTPKIPFAQTAEDSLRAFVGEGLLATVECAQVRDDSQRCFTAGCVNCAQFQEGEHSLSPLIRYVNLSMYPAPCQSRCIYCNVHRENQSVAGEAAKAAYEKLFDMLDLAQKSGILAPNAVWQVSSGEIAIHPYHDRIMKLVKGKTAAFYTNCMRFDEAVAQNLHENPNSAINLSIDCGTSETWKKVKGVDNFDEVLENLVKYHAASARPGQITLKYIIMPGLNDIYEDYLSLIEIMKAFEVKHLTLSRDTRTKYNMGEEGYIKLTGAAAYLLAMCYKDGFSNDMFTFTQEEQMETARLANEILQRGLV